MHPYYALHGDCLTEMKTLADNSIDSIVTDPPYELGFMGKSWDSSGIAFNVLVWKEALRILKPGGHLLAFSGSRTYHRMAVAIEDAGFEIRDQLMWVYGSGFPKSLNVAKSIEAKLKTGKAGPLAQRMAAMGEDYEPTPLAGTPDYRNSGNFFRSKEEGRTEWERPPLDLTTQQAQQWDGWHTALKPAHEPIVMARKPLEGTVAANVLKWGTGAINVDACRVPGDNPSVERRKGTFTATTEKAHESEAKGRIQNRASAEAYKTQRPGELLGRWPANFIHDGLDETWSKFFYCPKASTKDRDEGLEHMDKEQSAFFQTGNGSSGQPSSLELDKGKRKPRANNHPTVKPTDLMRYLCRLVTPLGGVVLDPFMGSGSTGKGAVLEGFEFIGIELSEEYHELALARIAAAHEMMLAA
jgi:DNA modification methylase